MLLALKASNDLQLHFQIYRMSTKLSTGISLRLPSSEGTETVYKNQREQFQSLELLQQGMKICVLSYH